MKRLKSILKHIIIALFYAAICIICWKIGRSCGVKKGVTDKLPTIEEIQQRVGATVDGKLGKETEKLWNQAICNQYASQYFQNRYTRQRVF